MGYNQNTRYDVSISITVSAAKLKNIITHSLSYAASNYDLQNSNCTDFAITVANTSGFFVPKSKCIGYYGVGNGSTPGKFGDYIKKMKLPKGASRNVKGGTSPSNKTCK